MTDNPRLRQLLDELHESQATPEEVCRSCPELLPEVRARWQAVCRVRAELDALWPMIGSARSLPRGAKRWATATRRRTLGSNSGCGICRPMSALTASVPRTPSPGCRM
jgi:hypothetical protein